ncbi:response regulator [Gemmatimonadota bacterium]
MAKNILVVDDEPDVREFLSDYLGDNGYNVQTAEDGTQALKLIEVDIPDLILLDLMMPEETGTGLYRKLHDKKAYKEIPVIVISGAAGRDVAVSKSVPVFDKPIDKEALLSKIQEIVGAV